jgi:hypothetical protein
MSTALLSVLLVCNRRILGHRGKFGTCYVHFDRSACQALHWRKLNSVFNVKKINQDFPLCQNNLNGVYVYFWGLLLGMYEKFYLNV